MKVIDKQAFANDFRFEWSGNGLSKCWYVGKDYRFDRPKNLTNWDIACALDVLNIDGHWTIIYDVYNKRQLLSYLYRKCEFYSSLR